MVKEDSRVVIPRIQHPLLKHLDKLLPKFNLDNKEPIENHIDKFILVVQTMNVQHEDVICHPLTLTFKGKASAWYFSLVQGSITNWVDFSQAFIDKFGEDKSPIALGLDPSHIKIDNKERIKDFN